MASLYIAEYSQLPNFPGQPQIAPEPAVATQKVTYSTTSASAAFNAQTHYIGITSDGIFSYKVGTGSPTAAVTDFRVPADTILFMAVQAGDKIAAITNT